MHPTDVYLEMLMDFYDYGSFTAVPCIRGSARVYLSSYTCRQPVQISRQGAKNAKNRKQEAMPIQLLQPAGNRAN